MKKVIALGLDYLFMPSPLSLGTQDSEVSDSGFELGPVLDSCRKHGGKGYSMFLKTLKESAYEGYFQSALSPGKTDNQSDYLSVLDLLARLETGLPSPPKPKQRAYSFDRNGDDGIDRGSPPLI